MFSGAKLVCERGLSQRIEVENIYHFKIPIVCNLLIYSILCDCVKVVVLSLFSNEIRYAQCAKKQRIIKMDMLVIQII